MKKIGTIITLLVCMVSLQLYGQNIQIRGIVTDASDNSPLPGAFVAVQGTNTVSSTLNDGTYTITAPANAVLVFSFIGMESQNISINGRTVINVALSSSSVLEEVVVTAMGITREKKSLGYAVQAVDGSALTQVRTGNVINSLSGRVAGVQIISSSGQLGGGARINVRGLSSLTGENQPLFVVDGIAISNTDHSTTNGISAGYNMGNLASDISPDDIENMSILKGASATAMYGSRGANGVVLITTKKGQMGTKTFGVSMNSSVTFDNVAFLPKYQKLYGGGEEPFQTITVNGRTYNYPHLDVDESWGPKFDPNIKVLTWNSFDSWDTANYMVEKPWVYPENDYTTYYKTGVGFNNNIQIAGSDVNYTYRLSYTNLDQTGILENSKLKRNNISFSGTAKINKRLESFANFNYIITDAKGRPETGYGDNATTRTMFQWTQVQLDYKELRAYKNPDGTQRTWNRNSFDNPNGLYSDNPYWTLYENYETDRRDRFFGSGGAILDIADGLKLTGRAGIDAYVAKQEFRSAMGSVNSTSYSLRIRNNVEVSADLFLNFNKRVADNKIGISAMLGTSTSNRIFTYTGGYTNSGLLVPGVYNLANSVNPATPYDSKSRKRINSAYGNFTIDWNMLVYLDVTARNDWSSALPSANRSYFYPSVNFSFILSQLGGLSNLSWLTFAKLRAGYAEVGNDTDSYRLQNYYEFVQPFGGDPRFSLQTTLQNPELRPERTRSWEVGLEAHLFNNRLSVDLAYYQKSSIDQIVNASISPATGYSLMAINTGEIQNKGLEITIDASPMRNNNGLNWDVQFNLATLNNMVVSIAEGVKWLNLSANGFSLYTGAHEGESYPVIYGKDFVYGPNGEKLINRNNGTYLRTTDDVPLAKVTPDFTAGLSNHFSYKGIDLSILFDMQMGGHMHYMSHMWGMYSGLLEETAQKTNVAGKTGDVREDGWLFPGMLGINVYDAATQEYHGQYVDANGNNTTSPIPNERVVDGYTYAIHHYTGPNQLSVFKTDYIKLREVRIGYTLPNKWTGPIKDLRISVFGRNLATFMAATKHFDPEYLTSAGANAQGLEGGYVPTTRTYGCSIGFNF